MARGCKKNPLVLKGHHFSSFAYGNKNIFICFFHAKALVFLPLTRIIMARNLKFIIKKYSRKPIKKYFPYERLKNLCIFHGVLKNLSAAEFLIWLIMKTIKQIVKPPNLHATVC